MIVDAPPPPGAFERRLVVIGSVPELDGLEVGTTLLRRSPSDPVGGLGAVGLVLDAREHPVHVLARARGLPSAHDLPALVVARDEDADTGLLESLGAVGTLCLEPRAARQQLAMLVALGESRLAQRRAERFAGALERELCSLHDLRAERELAGERHRFERLVAMGTMVAGFAHEIRNPVAALLSMVEEVGEELSSAGLALPHIPRMVQILQRIERLVRTSLQFGRPDAPRRARHRPWSIAAQAIADVGARTRGAGQALHIDIDADLPDVFCDDAQIARALGNLLNNALDAAGSPSRVQLGARVDRRAESERPPPSSPSSSPPPARWVRFEVRNDGPGIAPELMERIFDPFFTTKPSGTGLGLSIAQQVVSDNGGRLEASSPRGGPTTFAIVIPAEL